MRDHIVCVAADDSVRSGLHQQLGSWLGEVYVLDAVRSTPLALRLFDELQQAGDTIAVLLVAHDRGPTADRSAATSDTESGLALLTEAHQRFPLAGKVLLVQAAAPDQAELLGAAVRQAGLSSYLYSPHEPLQLRLLLEGLLFQHRLQRKNERLHYTLQDQKRELEVMNHNLEARIRERTMALEEANRRLSQLAVTEMK